jgi:long-chain acyl-CoA synthetase
VLVHDGSNISPAEVEDALAEHPAVALVGVVGIDDEVHGENVRACVGYEAPEEVVFLDEMPLNATGKIDRVELKNMAEDHLHPHGLGA